MKCVLFLVVALTGCVSVGSSQPPRMQVAHLSATGSPGLESLKRSFEERNPGYALEVRSDEVPAADVARVVFVQSGQALVQAPGSGRVEKVGKVGSRQSPLDVGDIVLLRSGESLQGDGLHLVVFSVPHEFDAALPTFIRPDWDENITDTPGGCATESGAYRRILLTWLPERGPYINHDLNAHRVRIDDSFTHYHPVVGGFDEFYLVQMVQPGATLITSRQTRLIESACGGGDLSGIDASQLLDEQLLAVGDLVYLPRELTHRGLNGVLAQVIAVPGFRPNAEIGLDHCLRAINEQQGLTGASALPFNAKASTSAVVK